MMDGVDPQPPLVSVIVPAFNASESIAETLESISRQSYRKIEILIVDDGSTDDTRTIALSFCKVEPRARLIAQDNRGVAAARNAGLRAASGRFAAPIDADDLWHPDYVSTLVEMLLQTGPAPVMAYAASRLIDARSRVIGSALAAGRRGRVAREMLFLNLVGNGSAMIFDRELALQLGGYDPRLRDAGAEGYEDWLLQMMLASSGPVASTRAYLVGYRQLSRRMSADGSQMARSQRLACQLYMSATGCVLAGRGDRWKRATEAMREARYSVRTGAIHDGMVLLGRALFLDPVGVGVAVLSRLVSRARRARPPSEEPSSFLQADPDDHGQGGLGSLAKPSLFDLLQQRRLKLLASADDAAFAR